MNMQAIVDAIGEASKNTRADYHLTLGRLISQLEVAESDEIVKVDTGGTLGAEESYRGYYCDMAFNPSQDKKTVGELLQQCRAALGEIYEGYKGGDYRMEDDTPLWLSDYGEASGIALMGAVHRPKEKELMITTKNVDED